MWQEARAKPSPITEGQQLIVRLQGSVRGTAPWKGEHPEAGSSPAASASPQGKPEYLGCAVCRFVPRNSEEERGFVHRLTLFCFAKASSCASIRAEANLEWWDLLIPQG